MPIIGDLIHSIQLAIDTFWYQGLLLIASFQWNLLRGMFMMGFTIQLLTQWLAAQVFSPLILQTGASLRVATSLAFIFALIILGATYMLASIVKLEVVNPRNAILWYIAGILFFQIGPVLYQGMNDFRRSISSAFYLSVLDTMNGTSGSALSPLNSVQSSDLGILTPCDNFGPYLGRSGGSVTINGLDVALAYLRADGIDVMGYPYPAPNTCQPHSPAQALQLPWDWYRFGSYFDLSKSPTFYPTMTDAERAASEAMASASLWRLFSSWALVWFGVFEQITALCMTIAQGLTFISFACAILFAFFKRTESIAWSIVDQWLELIVQTVIIAMLQALVTSFFLAGAATNNPLVVMGIGLVCLVFIAMLVWSGVKAILRSLNRLTNAMGQATGGSIISVGSAAQGVASAGMAAASGGISLAGNALGGATALANGGSWSQAAGVALGGSQALTGAARTLSRLPGLRDTELADAADHFVEGATTRQVARNVPVIGGVTGPVGGAMLLTDRNPAHADEDGAPPMLIPAVGKALAGLTRGPGWSTPDTGDGQEGWFEPLALDRVGSFTPIRAVSGEDIPDEIAAAEQRSDAIEQETSEELEQHISEVAETSRTDAIDKDKGTDSSRLEAVSARLEQAADALERAARQSQMQYEGRLTVSGASNVGSVMGDVVGLLQRDPNGTGSVDNFTVASVMAEALGVTPIENGKPPIEQDLAQFGLFTGQALTMGLNPEQTEQVVRDVKESPDGMIQPETRTALVEHLHTERGLSHDEANQQVDTLESTARMLPNEITAYGVMSVPAPAPVVTVAPQIAVQPNVQITVETDKRDAYSEGLKDDAAMTGSAAILTSTPTTDNGGAE